MATRRQNIKDIENKQAQARESYAKNKTLLGEYQVKEKASDVIHKKHKEAGKYK